MTKNANYRKHNDRQLNSSTYHKKDGTEIRAILKREAQKEIEETKKEIELNYNPTDLPKNWELIQQYHEIHCEVIIDDVCQDVWWNTEKSCWEISGIDF